MEIRGAKVILRDWKEKDLPSYRSALAPTAAWHKLDAPYLPFPTGGEIDALIQQKRALILTTIAGPRTELVIADPISDAILGRVSRYWQSEETEWLSIGIAIFLERDWGSGFGREALGLWCDYLFSTLPQIVRLDLRTWDGNQRMIGLATRLGFREEARFRKARIVDGKHCDGLGFGALREEWVSTFPNGFLGQPNQPAQSTTPAVTPPAGQEARQP